VARHVAPALRALLANLIDYAGLFPPAALPMDAALANYERYRSGEHAWMLGRFVISAAQIDQAPENLDWPFAVLSDSDHSRAAAIESKRVVSTRKPTYCEVPMHLTHEVKQAGSFLKIRMGGQTEDAVPEIKSVAAWIVTCAERRLPFKATAGLHHPIRAQMHGFINLFLAAAFAWGGERNVQPILEESDAAAFRFDDRAHWRDRSLAADEIAEARRDFAHSFGSCSFEEPIQDLEKLRLL
jgi:hypothetical protein